MCVSMRKHKYSSSPWTTTQSYRQAEDLGWVLVHLVTVWTQETSLAENSVSKRLDSDLKHGISPYTGSWGALCCCCTGYTVWAVSVVRVAVIFLPFMKGDVKDEWNSEEFLITPPTFPISRIWATETYFLWIWMVLTWDPGSFLW